jgi:hypothetical protein
LDAAYRLAYEAMRGLSELQGVFDSISQCERDNLVADVAGVVDPLQAWRHRVTGIPCAAVLLSGAWL